MPIRAKLLTAYLAVALAVLTGAALRGPLTADGLLLGLPAGLLWTVATALTTFLALAVYDAAAERARGVSPGASEGHSASRAHSASAEPRASEPHGKRAAEEDRPR